MRLHDLRPADGSRKERTRVGRGIAAGKGKTAGRGTKGQKARAGGGIPAWFEGGQTPLHQRIPKLRGFKNRFKIDYEIVNVGDIEAAVQRGAFEAEAADAKPTGKTKAAPQITVNQDILRAVGLVRSLDKPLKVLGAGDLTAALFVVADGFSASARSKIEAAGGTVNVLEVPTTPLKAIGVESADERTPAKLSRGGQAAADKADRARAARADTAEAAESGTVTQAPAAAAPEPEPDADTPVATAVEVPEATAEVVAPATTETPDAEAETPTEATETADTAATTKPRRAAKAKAAATEAGASTDTEPEPETATAASDEAETASGDDA